MSRNFRKIGPQRICRKKLGEQIAAKKCYYIEGCAAIKISVQKQYEPRGFKRAPGAQKS